MASSIIDKYEQILAADPRSRIFVELAKALVDRGEHARAIDVCRRGLEHHPSSILGRVTWGRALLESGDPKGAMDQFEIAIALEPASPYAYNHVGEALLAKGLLREALPVLARAAELQPADARVRGWLEDAKRRLKGEPAPATAGPPPPDLSLEDESEKTEPYRPISRAARAAPAPEPASEPGASSAAAPPPTAAPEDGAAATPTQAPASAPPVLERAKPQEPPAAPPPLPPGARPPAVPPSGPRSVLYMIPGETTRDVVGPSLASRLNIPAVHPTVTGMPAASVDHAAADRAAAEYERTLREKLMAEPEPPPSFLHRHRRLVLAGIVALALGVAGGVYHFVAARNAAIEAAGAAGRARAGLARDTVGALRDAHRLLSDARAHSSDPELASLAAQVAAVLGTEYADEKALEVARALAPSGAAAAGGAAAGWLLAKTPGERAPAEAAILAARPSEGALLQDLAGRILISRGEVEGGKGRLELAARSNPPFLRALSDLGDLALRGGDAEGALAFYAAALAAHPTHPRSAVGAAEARLALGRELETSRRELAAVDADAASAPPPELKARFEIVTARVAAALGEPGPAAARLARWAEGAGETAQVAGALAELQLAARAWDKAEGAAQRAVSRDPRDADLRVLLARARIGRGRYMGALSATEGLDGRAVRIQRAIARYRLGQYADARAELERTAHDGKMPAEAAVWYALVDVSTGKADRALPLLEKLAAAPAPPPLAHVALGRALEALGRGADAEAAYRKAADREPGAPEPAAALGRFLLAAGRARDAVAPLEHAAKLDPADVAVRRALAEARLAAGHPAAARADLDFVLMSQPKDPAALRLLSAAWLAEGQPREARRAADQAVAISPKDPAALLQGARAAVAEGDGATAKKLAERAVKAGATAADRDEAKRLAAGQLPRKR